MFAGSRDFFQSLHSSPNVPAGATAQASSARMRASALLDGLTTRSVPTPAAVGASQGAQPPHPPPPSPPTHSSSPPTSLTSPPSFILPPSPAPPRSGHPQTAAPSERSAPATLHLYGSEAGRQQPLSARPLGLGVPARPPAELGVSGRPRGAMIYYTAVPASGTSSAGRPLRDARGPAPAPQRSPRHKHPAPGPSPAWTEPGDATHPRCPRARLPDWLRPASSSARRHHHAALRPGLPQLLAHSFAAAPKRLRLGDREVNPRDSTPRITCICISYVMHCKFPGWSLWNRGAWSPEPEAGTHSPAHPTRETRAQGFDTAF